MFVRGVGVGPAAVEEIAVGLAHAGAAGQEEAEPEKREKGENCAEDVSHHVRLD